MNKRFSRSGTAGMFLYILFLPLIPLAGQAEIQDSLARERLKEIQTMFNQNKISASHWRNAWIWGYNAATIAQGIVYFTSDSKATRQDMALGSATTILGALSLILAPVVPNEPYLQDSQFNREIPGVQSTDTESFEYALKETARREKLGRSWKAHAVCSAANLGSGLITWIGFNRTFYDGLVNFALNSVITEAQIWSQPTRAIKDYQNYCKKYKLGSGYTDSKPETEWFVDVYPGRISLRVDF